MATTTPLMDRLRAAEAPPAPADPPRRTTPRWIEWTRQNERHGKALDRSGDFVSGAYTPDGSEPGA